MCRDMGAPWTGAVLMEGHTTRTPWDPSPKPTPTASPGEMRPEEAAPCRPEVTRAPGVRPPPRDLFTGSRPPRNTQTLLCSVRSVINMFLYS